MAISPLLQIRRMLARRLSGDVSITHLLVLEFGFFLWIGYGIALGNPFIVFPNSVAAVVGALTMLVAWLYRNGVRVAQLGVSRPSRTRSSRSGSRPDP